MKKVLTKEIDFDLFAESGVIEHHFHLHKESTIKGIGTSFLKRGFWLENNFFLGFFSHRELKHIQPLNMVRNYMGEKMAFEFAFLIYYDAWLRIASFLGIVLVIVFCIREPNQGWDSISQDSPLSAIYSFLICLLAAVFVEKWKVVQT